MDLARAAWYHLKMRALFLSPILLALWSCGPGTLDGATAPEVAGHDPSDEPAPPADHVLDTAVTGSPLLHSWEALSIKVLNLYNGLVIASYLDYLQAYAENPTVPFTGAGDPDGTSFSSYMKSVRGQQNLRTSSVLYRFFSRLKATPGLDPNQSLLDHFNGFLLDRVDLIIKDGDGLIHPEDYRWPVMVHDSTTPAVVDLGSFPLWLNTLKRYPERILGETEYLTTTQRAVASTLISSVQQVLTEVLFTETSLLRWKVGTTVYPVVETSMLPGDPRPRPLRIFIPARGQLELLRDLPNNTSSYLPLSVRLEDLWRPRIAGSTYRIEHNLLDPFPGGRLGFLERSYGLLPSLISRSTPQPITGRTLPIYRGLNTGVTSTTPLRARPFTHLYFVDGSADRQLLWRDASHLISQTRVSRTPNQELQNYLSFLLRYGVAQSVYLSGAANVPYQSSEMLLKTTVMLDTPTATPLDAFLLMIVTHLSIASANIN